MDGQDKKALPPPRAPGAQWQWRDHHWCWGNHSIRMCRSFNEDHSYGPCGEMDPTMLCMKQGKEPDSIEMTAEFITPTSVATQRRRAAPTCEPLYLAVGSADTAATQSDNLDDDEPGTSRYVLQPWTILGEFGPTDVA